MRTRAGALALFAAIASIVIGCSKADEQASVAPGARNPWTIPGVLRIAARQEPDTLVPIIGTQVVDTDLAMFWDGFLFDWSDADELVPELATQVPTQENGGISRDGLTITYHVRRGVTWHDGAPFTADDVVFTWQQIMNPENPVPGRAAYEVIRRIDEPDPYTIVVHLRHPFAGFVNTFLTMSATTYGVIPKHLLAGVHDISHTDYASKPVGTGPFIVAAYDRGSQIRLVANPHYWRGPPKLKEIDFRFIGSDETALALLKAHDIDFYYRAAEALAPSLQGIPGTRIVLSPFTRFLDLGFNAGTPALSDVRVRRALAYGTDTIGIIRKVTHGIDSPADSDQPPYLWAHDAGVTKYPFDPRTAAALLDAAGWEMGADGVRHRGGDRLALTMVSYTGSPVITGTEAVLQQQWRELGIDVTIKNYPTDVLYRTKAEGGIEQTGKFDVAVENWANGPDPDESVLFRCDLVPPDGWNIYHFCEPALDAAETRAEAVYDRTARKKEYAKIQEILTSRLPIYVLWFTRDQHVINTDFKNFKPAHAATPFWNPWEWEI